MKTVLSFFATLLFAGNAFSQTSSAEVSCRAQAKETAVQTYSSCITVARNNQVDEIRKNYQKELANLKAKYDKELKKMGAAAAAKQDKKAAKNAVPSAKELKQALNSPASLPTKGVAKQLPSKAMSESDAALPVQTVSEGTKVVAVDFEENSNVVESEAAEAEKIEIVEMPIE